MGMTKSQIQMLNRLVKNTPASQLQGTFKQGEYWIVTDTFICLYLKEKPDLPICQGVDTNMFRFIDLPSCAKTKRLPDIDFVKKVKKLSSASGCQHFSYEIDTDTHVRVNPCYLWQMMKILPNARNMFYTVCNKQIVVMDDEGNYGMLVPIRYDKNAIYINEQGELINPNLGEEIKQEEI